ncbi:hypothetical protein EIP91_008032 [Steccherinum ochraceum]|uniref:RPA43 OB domain-containing protein n=1 Tax=Steccherinum ochraceum TaxID=92696 RepID=A0A4R0R3G6_9APHY|nr:hypothetical protein EIP91_008032 [Steccherinum ochraceum]
MVKSEETAKKRKHAPIEVSAGEPSTKRSKIEKASKKVHKEKKEKRKGKDKAGDGEGEFRVFQATLALSIPPVFASNLRAGAEEMLDSMVMRYIPALQGVVLSHSNLQFLESAATIKADCPFSNVTVVFEAMVWSPQVGMKLSGKVNLCSPDHISLLVHRTFNVSIPRRHIPTESWEFEYGPAENDPEFGAEVEKDQAEGEEEGENQTVEGSGKWVHKLTGSVLGGSSGQLEFSVIGLTIANQMLSLVGSLQSEPFAIEDEYLQTVSITPATHDSRTAISSRTQDAAEDVFGEEPSESDDDELLNTSGRIVADAVVQDSERKEATAGSKDDRKRKRKAEDASSGAKRSKS